MMDKIFLHTKEFSVDEDNNLIIKNCTSNSTGAGYKEVFLYQAGAKPIFGNKAFYNFTPIRDGFRATLTINGYGLNISFNPSAFYSANNLNLIKDPRKIENMLSKIETRLEQIGVKVNILQMGVSKIDLAQNIILDYPYSNYLPMWRSMHGNRMLSKDYDDSIYWENKSRKIKIYNKSKEMGLEDVEITRLELSFSKRQVVKRDLGIYTCGDFINAPHCLDKFREIFCKILEEILFNVEPIDSDYRSLAEQIYAQEPKDIKYIIQEQGLKRIIEKLGNLQAFLDILRDMDMKKSTFYSKRRKYKKLLLKSGNEDSKSTASLYNEFYNKVLSKASVEFPEEVEAENLAKHVNCN